MGTVYDRNKDHPERGPNIWIKFKDPGGEWQYRPIGRLKATGLTKAKLRSETRKLEQRAADVLTKIEGDIVAGRYGLVDETKPTVATRRYEDVTTEWINSRKEANEKEPTVYRAWRDDQSRIKTHLIPFFRKKLVGNIDAADLKKFINAKRGELSRQSIVHCLNLISRMYNDLREEGEDVINPVQLLDRRTREAIGVKRDPKKTPFLRHKDNIRSVHLAMVEPFQVMFDVGVFAGLRTGEVQALEPGDIDLRRRRIAVMRSVDGPLKDNDCRDVPILDTLQPILKGWMLRAGSEGPLFKPTRGRGQYIRKQTMYKHLRKALKSAKLPTSLTWYQCTRHTFASHWVMDGRPIRKLQEILGHSSVTVTERYAHLSPELYNEADYAAVGVDLSACKVIPLAKGGENHLGSDQPCDTYVTLGDS